MPPSIQVSVTTTPDNKRFFRIFKPSEVVQAEKFQIVFLFRNLTEEDFDGGDFLMTANSPERSFTYHSQVVEIPTIPKGGQASVRVKEVISPYPGINALKFLQQRFRSARAHMTNSLFIRGDDGRDMVPYSFQSIDVVSRDELYQKYAVIAAIGSSIIATIASTIAVAITIRR